MNKDNRHDKMGDVICTVLVICINQYGVNTQNIQGTWENQFDK